MQQYSSLQLHRPFGPTIGMCKLPQELIDDFNKDCESIMDHPVHKKTHDFSANLVGNVKQELTISNNIFQKWASYFNGLATTYIKAHEGNKKQLDELVFQSAWYVRSFAGDFNPAHYHSNCHLSTIGYLKIPEKIEEEWEEEAKGPHPSAGIIEMQYGQYHLFSGNTFRNRPKVGDFYIFPWWMYHMVYPFRSKGERRSFSFNILGKNKIKDN
tara:strand:- start:478 stop:1116 length:639 start_codon:yes stop_codon:yes gene_type:complete